MQTPITIADNDLPIASRREWIALAVLALPTLLASMDATVTYLALPSISKALKPGSAELLWVTDIFTFLEGGFLIVMGTLGDRLGQRRLLLVGAVLFAAASAMAAFSRTAGMLILARAFLGITGAILLPCTLALIRNMFHDSRQRAIAFGIYTTIYSGGTMLGPVIGGVLLSTFWWGSVFLISVPVMILFLFFARQLPEFRDRNVKEFDFAGSFLLVISILLIIFGIKRIAEKSAVDGVSIFGIASGSIVAFFFMKRQKKIRHPLIDLRLFKIPAFNATLMLLFISLFCWSGLYLFVTQFLQLVLELSPLKAALCTLPPAALSMIACMFAPQLLRWFQRVSVMTLGMMIMAAGMFVLVGASEVTSVAAVVVAAACLSAGCGIVVTLGIDLVVSTAPADQAGAASGISETSTTFGTAFGVAILGSIGITIYRNQMPVFINNPAYREARNTLGEAITASKQLPGKSAIQLIESAKTAFVQSFNYSAWVAVALAVVITIMFVIVLLRRRVSP